MNRNSYIRAVKHLREVYEKLAYNTFKKTLNTNFKAISDRIREQGSLREVEQELGKLNHGMDKPFEKVYKIIGIELAKFEFNNMTGLRAKANPTTETQRTDYIDEWDIRVDQFMNSFAFHKIKNDISQTTIDLFRKVVRTGLDEGKSIITIMDEFQNVYPDINRNRAALIARTETTGAMNFGQEMAAKSTGYDYEKSWLNSGDNRVRGMNPKDEFSHLDIQSVKRDDKFSVSGEELEYPGDKSGSAGNVINCRCTVFRTII